MVNTVTLTKTQYEQLVKRVDRLEKIVKLWLKTVKGGLEAEPPYGSDEWWEWSDKKAIEDIKAGRYTTIRNEKDLKEFFKKL